MPGPGTQLPMLAHQHTALQQLMRYGGVKALGAILSSRKGVFGLIVIGLSYYLLLGRLPVDAPPEVVSKMGEIFGLIAGVVGGLFIGGTALEDALSKGARRAGKGWLIPYADATGKTFTAYMETGDVDPVEICRAVVASADAQKKPEPTSP